MLFSAHCGNISSLTKPAETRHDIFPRCRRVSYLLARSSDLPAGPNPFLRPSYSLNKPPAQGRAATRTRTLPAHPASNQRGVVGGLMQQESTYASVAAPKANHGRPPPPLPLSSPDWRQTRFRWDDICQRAAGILRGLPHDSPLLRPRFPTLSHQICRWGSRRPWPSGSPERADRRSCPGSRAGKWITARKDGDFIATSLHACSWKPKWALMGSDDNLVGPAAASDAECWQELYCGSCLHMCFVCLPIPQGDSSGTAPRACCCMFPAKMQPGDQAAR